MSNANSTGRYGITYENIARLLTYNSKTGVLRWLVNANSSIRAYSVAGCNKHKGYIRVKIMKRLYAAHHLAWVLHYGTWPTKNLDHINGDRSDNRIRNLREANRSQQCWNSIGRSKLGFPKGVSTCHNRYKAQIEIDGRTIYLGVYDTPDEAHAAYCSYAKDIHGEFFCDGVRA